VRENDAFTVKDVARITGASEHNVRFWVGKVGIIEPGVANPRVRRAPKMFSTRNLVQLAVVKIMAERGIGLDIIKEAMRYESPSGLDVWDPGSAGVEVFVCVQGRAWYHFYTESRNYTGRATDLFERLMSSIGKLSWAYTDVVVVNLTTVKEQVRARTG
jgi:DNA-binding transcriptional MerR regulator